MRLFHRTCSHGAEGILRDGVVRVHEHPFLPVPLLWLHDDLDLGRDALGLTSHLLVCDRTEWAFALDLDAPVTFLDWVATAVPDRRERAALLRRFLAPAGVRVRHWYVSEDDLVPTEVVRYPLDAVRAR